MARGNEEKKGHPVRNTAIAAALVAMLIGGGRLGAGLGKSVGESMFLNQGKEPENTGTAQTETVQQEQPSPETAETPDDGVLEIVVREDAVLYEGEQTDLAGLEAALLRDYADGVRVTLTDDHAIKAAYDEVAALLSTLGIEAE